MLKSKLTPLYIALALGMNTLAVNAVETKEANGMLTLQQMRPWSKSKLM